MSDDLVKRLRSPINAMRPTLSDGRAAADRIEELEAENKRLRLEVHHANDVADAAIEGSKELQAKLQKAVASLETLEDASKVFGSDTQTDRESLRYAHECTRRLCKATLAELKGEDRG
jgi:hypothetical protein